MYFLKDLKRLSTDISYAMQLRNGIVTVENIRSKLNVEVIVTMYIVVTIYVLVSDDTW